MKKSTALSVIVALGVIGTFVPRLSAAADLEEKCNPQISGQQPPWLSAMPSREQYAYTSEQWYQDWLTTTTSLCTNLSNLYADNPKYSNLIRFRSDRYPLFRGGSGRPVEDILAHGFYPWKDDGTLDFPTEGNNQQSALTNTGYDAFYTFAYGLKSNGGQGYVIDAPGGIDQDGTIAGKPLKNVVLFPGGIRADMIKAAFYYETKNGPLKFVFNRNYPFPAPTDDEFDLIASPMSITNVADGVDLDKVKVVVTPAGTPIGHVAQRFKKGTALKLVLENGTAQSDKRCWYVNGAEKNSGSTLDLPAADEKQPMLIVIRASCGLQLTNSAK